jgi:hypothetical protein
MASLADAFLQYSYPSNALTYIVLTRRATPQASPFVWREHNDGNNLRERLPFAAVVLNLFIIGGLALLIGLLFWWDGRLMQMQQP